MDTRRFDTTQAHIPAGLTQHRHEYPQFWQSAGADTRRFDTAQEQYPKVWHITGMYTRRLDTTQARIPAVLTERRCGYPHVRQSGGADARKLNKWILQTYAGFYWWSCGLFLEIGFSCFCLLLQCSGFWIGVWLLVLCSKKLLIQYLYKEVGWLHIYLMFDWYSWIQFQNLWNVVPGRKEKSFVGQHLHPSTSASTRAKGVVAPFQKNVENERRL